MVGRKWGSMSKEEKINTLKAIIQECEDYQWQRKITLYEIIKDLEQEPILDKIRAEMLEEMLSHSGTGEEVIQAYADGLKKGLAILDKYKEESEE